MKSNAKFLCSAVSSNLHFAPRQTYSREQDLGFSREHSITLQIPIRTQISIILYNQIRVQTTE